MSRSDEFLRVLVPSLVAYEFDESYAADVPAGDFSALLVYGYEVLGFQPADRHDDPSAFGELPDPRFGYFRPGSAADDPVERRLFSPAECPVADRQRYVGDPQLSQHGISPLSQCRDPLDGKDLLRQVRQYRCLVSAACADIEDAVAWADSQFLAHKRYYVGLGYGLPVADVDGPILVCLMPVSRIDELLPRHLSHHRQDTLVAEAAGAKLTLDHCATPTGKIISAGVHW